MGKLLEIETGDVIPFKTLIEGLKDILNDINFEITRNDDSNEKYEKCETKKDDNLDEDSEDSDSDSEDSESSDSESDSSDEKSTKKSDLIASKETKKNDNNIGGIKITATDSTKTLLINVKLGANQFSKFYCKKKMIDLGINLGQFHKLIKSLDKDDILSMIINEEDKQNLVLKVSNPEKKYATTYKLKLMEIDKTQYKIPPTTFDSKVSFETAEFHRICREMNQIAEHIEIKCTKKTITFSCKGDCSERSTIFYADNNGVNINFGKGEKIPEIVQGIFELKNLVMFSKYSNLCQSILIFMKNNYPLCIKYTIATLGHMLFCLTPIKEDDLMENFSDEEDDYDEETIKLKQQ